MTLVSFCRKTHDLVLFKVETKGVCKKSGLASEALSRVQKQLEQNSQFLQILLFWYIVAFFTLKIEGDMNQNVKKWIVTK